MTEKLSFHLAGFDGPLDALLYLITKNKLNIYDISISELLAQYMQTLEQMSEMDLEVTSDFLEMASRLVQIKSAMLLPRHEEDQSEDPRAGLMAELIEYKTCKEMADVLRARMQGFNMFTREPMELEGGHPYKLRHETAELLRALAAVSKKVSRRVPPPPSAITSVVGRPGVTVTSRVIFLLRRLMRESERSFNYIFSLSHARSEAVATFLALLELVKSGQLAVLGPENALVVKFVGRKREHPEWKKEHNPSMRQPVGPRL